MSRITDAMDVYFERLTKTWQEENETGPMTPWDEEYDQNLFVSGPDDEEYAEWKVAEAQIPVSFPEMNEELREFFGSRRFWRMCGEVDGAEYTFPAIPTDMAAEKVARTAVKDGEYYLGQGYAVLAIVAVNGNDELLLLYNWKNGQMTILDTDRQVTYPVEYTLPELIERMEALI
ncbi:MAG: hypothetical protein Q4E13_05565 [Clostridia bacterium]|nr:hypothetical protein [Clostridia bacterium]